ncbi:hypothetical protein [Gordonia sp. VNK21]|uniref:hypothetical protein n=1 Tax=Gordonia sp. VNK21 TaxID=3382483 RepID=UPI0038D47DD6
MIRTGSVVIGHLEYVDSPANWGRVQATAISNGEQWLPADPDEFGSGYVYWYGCGRYAEGTVVCFTVEPNSKGKDKFMVRHLVPIIRIMDQRNSPYAEAVNRLHADRVPLLIGPNQEQAWVACADDIVVGPMTIDRDTAGQALLRPSSNLSAIHFRSGTRLADLAGYGLWMLADTPSDGVLDCRSDVEILRSALGDAARVLKNDGRDTPDWIATSKLISEAITSENVTSLSSAAQERLNRALELSQNQATANACADKLATVALATPDVATAIDEAKERGYEAGFTTAAHDFEIRHKEALVDVAELEAQTTALRTQRDAITAQLDQMEVHVAETLSSTSASLGRTAADALLLRTLAGESTSGPRRYRVDSALPPVPADVRTVSAHRVFGRSSDVFGDKALRTALARIHAALGAGMLPILTGPGATAVAEIYARVTVAGRVATLPISHDFLQPHDLLGIRSSDGSLSRPFGDLLVAAAREVSSETPGLVVLEGVNRAPTETYLSPWMSRPGREILVPQSARTELGTDRFCPPPELQFIATAVAGSTCAPVGLDLWTHSVAIEAPVPAALDDDLPVSVVLGRPVDTSTPSAKVLSTIAEGKGIADNLWPLSTTIWNQALRFGSELEQNDRWRLTQAVTQSLLLPALASALHGDDLIQASEIISRWAKPQDQMWRNLCMKQSLRLNRTFG